jgi:hypothetical protein
VDGVIGYATAEKTKGDVSLGVKALTEAFNHYALWIVIGFSRIHMDISFAVKSLAHFHFPSRQFKRIRSNQWLSSGVMHLLRGGIVRWDVPQSIGTTLVLPGLRQGPRYCMLSRPLNLKPKTHLIQALHEALL